MEITILISLTLVAIVLGLGTYITKRNKQKKELEKKELEHKIGLIRLKMFAGNATKEEKEWAESVRPGMIVSKNKPKYSDGIFYVSAANAKFKPQKYSDQLGESFLNDPAGVIAEPTCILVNNEADTSGFSKTGYRVFTGDGEHKDISPFQVHDFRHSNFLSVEPETIDEYTTRKEGKE